MFCASCLCNTFATQIAMFIWYFFSRTHNSSREQDQGDFQGDNYEPVDHPDSLPTNTQEPVT
jgi:hypothetical protein